MSRNKIPETPQILRLTSQNTRPLIQRCFLKKQQPWVKDFLYAKLSPRADSGAHTEKNLFFQLVFLDFVIHCQTTHLEKACGLGNIPMGQIQNLLDMPFLHLFKG